MLCSNDYTKLPRPWQRERSNYKLTFSLSENNEADAREALAHGVNVAVVFQIKKGHALPSHYMGHEVIDGDLTDLRFTDDKAKDGRAVIVGVRAKGKAKRDASGFVKLSSLTGGASGTRVTEVYEFVPSSKC